MITRHAVMPIVILLLVLWAIYHTIAEMRQDKRIDQLEREIKGTAAGD